MLGDDRANKCDSGVQLAQGAGRPCRLELGERGYVRDSCAGREQLDVDAPGHVEVTRARHAHKVIMSGNG